MPRAERRLIALAPAVLACLITIAPAAGQQTAAEKPQMVEDVFKNVQVLKGIPVNEFMNTMGFFSAALGLNCTGCHVAESLQDWSKFAEDVPRKRMARTMIRMVGAINKAQFGGQRMLTCWSCHRGAEVPPTIPSLMDQYNVPPEDPNAIEIVPNAPKEPTADQLLDKFIRASGNAQSLGALSSWYAKGTIEGFDTYHLKVPVEIYANAPAQRTMISHAQNGTTTIVFNGSAGWIAGYDRPVRLFPMLPGAELDGGMLDAALGFPGGIKQALTDWKVGFPKTTIDDKVVNIVQGKGAGKTRVKLYFDEKTGLLTRQVRYTDTPIGIVPTQVDYADYREVAGVKLPWHILITWTDGQSDIQLSDIQANVRIDPSKFAKPAPAAVKPRGK
ncbi:MAG: photosynthetic reaction center cytochrome c subunit family protein [Acidobacteriota bacterium]|nr:photosynthetic reaction center cytochrome c subunit family protein [Acidobacteriota bacterium]